MATNLSITLEQLTAIFQQLLQKPQDLENLITTFSHDPENRLGFDEWFSRHKSTFQNDAAHLNDQSKCRLLLRKLDDLAYKRYADFILPSKPEDCQDTEFSSMSEDNFKSLIFIFGLKSDIDSDIRTKLLMTLSKKPETTLADLLEEVQLMERLKMDTKLIEMPKNSEVYAVKSNFQKKNKQQRQATHQQQITPVPNTPCWGCGEQHFYKFCKFKNNVCSKCKKRGNKDGTCKFFNDCKQKHNISKSNKVVNKMISAHVNTINYHKSRKYVTIHINQIENSRSDLKFPIKLQVDSGSDISIISQQNWEKLGSPISKDFRTNQTSATSASNNGINIIAKFECDIFLKDQVKRFHFHVSDLNLNLLGIDLFNLFDLWNHPLNNVTCNKIKTTSREQKTQQLNSRFNTLFDKNAMGLCTKTEVKLFKKINSVPVFRPARPVALAAKPQIDQELQRLESLGIISKVDFSEWAAPIVVVKKPNGKLRICGDYSTGLNDSLEPNKYPLPIPNEILSNLSGSKVFSKIDLSDAYFQVLVDEEARKMLTINTHRGLYTFNRLAMGIKIAPGVFQQLMDTMVAGLEGVEVYMDDIIVHGQTEEIHCDRLHKVLNLLSNYGFKLQFEKCDFYKTEVKYLGHIINQNGVRPDPNKISTIKKLQSPKDIQQLRSLLGSINHYGKFIPDMNQLRAPLDRLLQKDQPFVYSKECEQAFNKFKQILESDLLLTHFDPKLAVQVAADASNYGLGATLSHIFPDGSEKIIMHASRTLAKAEKNYSQIEKEGLGLIFAVKKFHKYIYGRKFTMLTDHKPLLSIFGCKKGIPVYTASRLQRWSLILLSYDFNIKYIKTTDFGSVDMLSRLIDANQAPEEEVVIAAVRSESAELKCIEATLTSLPVTFKMVVKATNRDKSLIKVKRFITNGWPKSCNDEYFKRRDSLSISNDCILFGDRLVIPKVFRKRIMKQLHRGHPGMERMKATARCHVYWPNIDSEICDLVRNCGKCFKAAKNPRKTTLESWPLCTEPLERIHVDIAEPKQRDYYVVIIDAYSKYPEIVKTNTVTSSKMKEILNQYFSRFGDAETVVSDNGTQFVSKSFEEFLESKGILHIPSPPYHPQSNGQAERFVDSLKRALLNMENECSSEEALQTFLQIYRSTPNSNCPDNKSPAELFLGRKLNTPLRLLKPYKNKSAEVNEKQNRSFNKQHGAKARNFKVGDQVYAKYYKSNKQLWVPGQIIKKRGNVIFEVSVSIDGVKKIIRSHTNQLKQKFTPCDDSDSTNIPLNILLSEFSLVNEIHVPDRNNEFQNDQDQQEDFHDNNDISIADDDISNEEDISEVNANTSEEAENEVYGEGFSRFGRALKAVQRFRFAKRGGDVI